MARPIPETPDLDLRKKSKRDVEVYSNESNKSIFDISDRFSNNTGKNFVIGTFSGWMAGMSVVKIGRIAAFGLGGSVILLHFASELGYINVNWERIKESAGQSQAWLDWLFRFVKQNSCYSVGFVGGFCFGIAST
ncbi:unnamed protein product [Arctia plantaginis]|uniref:FUN14 domain-containing protein 1 n=1 Tax=Arctia plantaginis TaxID=874455 RepID=A0A8S1ACA0_ARCPL|nr:unnamed protein product [Arctia plantaginis]